MGHPTEETLWFSEKSRDFARDFTPSGLARSALVAWLGYYVLNKATSKLLYGSAKCFHFKVNSSRAFSSFYHEAKSRNLCCYELDYRIFGYWLILCATHRHCIKMALHRPKDKFFQFHVQNVSSSLLAPPVKKIFFGGLVMAYRRCVSFRYSKEFNKHDAI